MRLLKLPRCAIVREASAGLLMFLGCMAVVGILWPWRATAVVRAEIIPASGGGSSSTATPAPTPTIVAVFTGVTTFGTAQDAANSIMFNETAGCINFEGATANAFQTRLCVVDPTVGVGVYNFPNRGSAGTSNIPTLEQNNTWVGNNTFNTGTTTLNATTLNTDAGFAVGTTTGTAKLAVFSVMTPDAPGLLVGTASNSWHIYEFADLAFDFNNGDCGTSACIDPSFWIHSHNQSTVQWGGFWHDATNFNIKTGTGAVKISNHLMLAGTAPTLSACGTSPTTVTGSDGAGHFTVGSAATGCVLTFNTTWSVVPECFENDQTSILAVGAVPTTTTITFTTTVASAISSQLISYHCVQGS